MSIEGFVTRARADPERGGFVLDFDGTLAQVVEEPSAAIPFPGVTEALEALAHRYLVVALLSGRRADDLARLAMAEGVRYLGIYGAEEFVGGRIIRPPESERWLGMASRLARDAEALILTEGLAGAEVEYKDVALSIHYRRARDPGAAGEAIISWAESAARRRGFEVMVGRMVVELRPLGVSKASALQRVVSELGMEWIVAAGDDTGDVHALTRAGEMLGEHALRIGIASEEEPPGLRAASDLVAGSPDELLEILGSFL